MSIGPYCRAYGPDDCICLLQPRHKGKHKCGGCGLTWIANKGGGHRSGSAARMKLLAEARTSHGTVTRYNAGCDCIECKAAKHRYDLRFNPKRRPV